MTRRLPSPLTTTGPGPLLAWTAGAVLLGAAAAWGAAGPLLVLGPLLLGAALALLGAPLPFLWILIATAGLGFGWIEESAFRVGGSTINLSGLRWGIAFLVAMAVLLRDGLPPLPRHLRGYGVFLLVATAGLLWTPARFEGIKHVIQFATPLAIGLLAIRAIRSEGDAERLRRAFWIGLAFAAAAGLALGLVGLGVRQPLDEGRLLHRSTGPYLLPLMALALAGWRFRSRAYGALVVLVFLLGLVTLSRATVLVMLGLLVLSAWGRSVRWVAGVALVVLVGGSLALRYEPFRERVLGDADVTELTGAVAVEGEGDEAQLVVAGVPLSGRGLVWLRTFRHAAESPVVGHGTGSSVQFLASEVAVGVIHPHNDYLRLFHDLGLVGLAVFLLASWLILRHFVRLHQRASSDRGRELTMAAALAFAGYLAILLFDNGLLYPTWLTQNVFILLVLGHRAAVGSPGAPEPSAPAGA